VNRGFAQLKGGKGKGKGGAGSKKEAGSEEGAEGAEGDASVEAAVAGVAAVAVTTTPTTDTTMAMSAVLDFEAAVEKGDGSAETDKLLGLALAVEVRGAVRVVELVATVNCDDCNL
jgi:hypothetical protein